MTRDVDTLPADMTLHGAATFLTRPETRHPSFPVVDVESRVLGVIDPPRILSWRRGGSHRSATLGALLEGAITLTAHPDEYLETLADRLMQADVAHVPVVTREAGRLVGYVGFRDIMRVRVKLRAEQEQRMVFIRGGRRKGSRNAG